MNRFFDPTVRFSVIEFNDLSKQLPEHANNIRRALEFYQSSDCDSGDECLRYSEEVSVTHATGTLLDALVIPYYLNMYARFQYQIECEEYIPLDEFENDDGYHDLTRNLLISRIDSLIRWRRKSDGSIIFLTDQGEVSPADIFVVIAQNDLNDFFEIVGEQAIRYGYAIPE